MLTRIGFVVFSSLWLAGCANEAPHLASLASTTPAALAPSPSAASGKVGVVPNEPYRKTMSDRVLAAIALERVTGLKPDPSRLTE